MGKENASLHRQIRKGRTQVEDLELQIERLQGQIQHFKNMEARVEEWEAAKKAKREMHSQATRENVFLRRDLSKCRLKMAEVIEGIKELGDAGKPLQKLLGVGENGGKKG
jgi:septal ring factor EnvC (AmiA/AmiB activator)